jgi:hypothetical protein
MQYLLLRKKLTELSRSNSTLLWLEGAKYERTVGVTLQNGKLLISLANETTRILAFERFAITAVGIQFWSQGRPGVLYQWEQVPRSSWSGRSEDGCGPERDLQATTPLPTTMLANEFTDDDFDPPPYFAA